MSKLPGDIRNHPTTSAPPLPDEVWRLPDGRTFVIKGRFYLASCDGCGWVGSSEECGVDFAGGDDTDVYCPKCDRSSADCGKVAETAVRVTP